MRFTTLKELAELVSWGPQGVGTQDKEMFSVTKEEAECYLSLLSLPEVRADGVLYYRGCKLVIE